MKVREERETAKKKATTFKATPSSFDEEESSEDGDEVFSMLIRNVAKYFSRKEDKATSKEEDIKEDFKEEGDESLLSLQEDGPSNCRLPLISSHYL